MAHKWDYSDRRRKKPGRPPVDKEVRQLVLRMAKEAGIENPRLTRGDPHFRLVGTVGGQPVQMVVSLSKCFATKRTQNGFKTTLKRTISNANLQQSQK